MGRRSHHRVGGASAERGLARVAHAMSKSAVNRKGMALLENATVSNIPARSTDMQRSPSWRRVYLRLKAESPARRCTSLATSPAPATDGGFGANHL